MKKVLLSSIALVAFIASGPATAADIALTPIYKTPVASPSPHYNWTGFYVGVNAGYGFADTSNSFSSNIFDFLPSSAILPNGKGFIGGAEAGYNWQNGNLVFGLEADISGSGMRGTASGSSAIAITTVEQKIPWFGTLRGRLGVLPADRLLIFASGGLAFGQTTAATTVFQFGAAPPCNVSCVVGSTSGNTAGWTVGGGFEYALWQNLSLKGEYLFVDLGSRSATYPITFSVGSRFTTNSGFEAHIARAGLNYKFGSH